MNEKGFTIVEALVAMMFLILAITPAVVVSTSALDVAARIQNDLTGALLAQEGIELVHFLRDYNWLACGDFSTGLIGGPYIIDVETGWSSCVARNLTLSVGSNSRLYIDNNSIFSHDSSGVETQFSRTVTVDQIQPHELRVISEVTWTTKQGTTYLGCPSGTRCVRAESHLYNWR